MRILVTGGAGFIGSHVCEALLSDGHKVMTLDNFNTFYDPRIKKENVREIQTHLKAKNFTLKTADIRDTRAVTRIFRAFSPDLVIHLAAMAGVRPSIQNPALYTDVNIRGTQVLLDACKALNVKNFVFASSSSIYGNNKKVPFSEIDRVDHPISPYAATKKAGELLCHTYTHLFGMKISCLRFFTVYGPRQRPDLAIHKFTKLLFKGETIPFFGDGSTKRDYTYIKDIVDGVLKAARWTKRAPAGAYEIFNLGESRTISLKELIRGLEKVTGRRAKLKRLPMQPGDVERTYADISKSKKVLGYDPRMDFEEGLYVFVDWYRGKHSGIPCRAR